LCFFLVAPVWKVRFFFSLMYLHFVVPSKEGHTYGIILAPYTFLLRTSSEFAFVAAIFLYFVFLFFFFFLTISAHASHGVPQPLTFKRHSLPSLLFILVPGPSTVPVSCASIFLFSRILQGAPSLFLRLLLRFLRT